MRDSLSASRETAAHAHLPPRVYAAGEVSVAHITGLAEQEIWDIGRNTLNPNAGRTELRGRAVLTVARIEGINLQAARDDTPFLRHSRIFGWPEGEDADVRHKELAKELAEAAQLVKR